MSSSTTTALSRQPLREVLKGVEDPRDRRGVRHCLTAAGCLAVVGVWIVLGFVEGWLCRGGCRGGGGVVAMVAVFGGGG